MSSMIPTSANNPICIYRSCTRVSRIYYKTIDTYRYMLHVDQRPTYKFIFFGVKIYKLNYFDQCISKLSIGNIFDGESKHLPTH